MKKLIIENRTRLPMSDVLGYVLAVMDKGKISNNGKQYCYHTLFPNDKIGVTSGLNKGSDKLIVSEVGNER